MYHFWMVPVVLNIPAPCLHEHDKVLLAGWTHYSCWEQLGGTESIGLCDQVQSVFMGKNPHEGSFASRLKRILIYVSFISFIRGKIIPWNEAALRCLSGPPAWAVSSPRPCLLCQYTTKDGALLPEQGPAPSTSQGWLQAPAPLGTCTASLYNIPGSQGSSVLAPHLEFYGPEPKSLQVMPAACFRSGSAATLCRDLRIHLSLNNAQSHRGQTSSWAHSRGFWEASKSTWFVNSQHY